MDGLVVAVSVLCVLVLVLAVVVFALARQVGVPFERVAPMGALVTDSGPRVGEVSPRFDLLALDGRALAVGAKGARAQLLFFVSPTCPFFEPVTIRQATIRPKMEARLPSSASQARPLTIGVMVSPNDRMTALNVSGKMP